jgi:hypothetical protein
MKQNLQIKKERGFGHQEFEEVECEPHVQMVVGPGE